MATLVESVVEGARWARERADAEKANAEVLERQKNNTNKQAQSWHNMARDTHAFATNIGSATVSLLKWSGVVGALSGLIGAGGLFGIDRLAQGVSGERKLSSGTGTTIGERNAFETNFNRLLDSPSGFLTSIFESQTDVTKAMPYGALGLDYNMERQKTTADASLDVLRSLKTLADQTPKEQLGTVFFSRQLAQLGISLEDFQRIKERSLSELGGYTGAFQRDRQALNVNDPNARAWEDLNAALNRAGALIKNTLINGLVGLTKPLEGLSATFANTLRDFLEGGTAKRAIDALTGGLVWLDETLADPQFREHMKWIITDVAALAEAIGRVLHKVAVWTGVSEQTPDDRPDPSTPAPYYQPDQGEPSIPPPLQMPPINPDFGGLPPGLGLPISFRAMSGNSSVTEAHDFFRQAGWTEDQTAGILANLSGESGFNPRAFNPSGGGQGAQGIAQWRGPRLDAFRRMFGHDPKDGTLEEQLWFVQHELETTESGSAEKLRRVGRNPGSAAEAFERYYERGEESAIAPRRNKAVQYKQQFRDRSVQIHIQNNTGGNANVTASLMNA